MSHPGMTSGHAGQTNATPTVMDRLRTTTAPLHEAAEHHAFQRALAKGQVTREDYASYLEQMLLVHRALESHLRDARERCVSVASVVRDWQMQEPYLAEDLAFLGRDLRSVTASPATAEFIAAIDAMPPRTDADLQLLGMHYVLEGSNNGSKFISFNIAKSLGLGPGAGMRYLDPYGDEQRARWACFKEDMLSIGFGDAEIEQIVIGANAMFHWIARISDDLAASTSVAGAAE
ncbi:MAG: biliverdin-producing heme oxygenase [Phycisphaerales bacterium]